MLVLLTKGPDMAHTSLNIFAAAVRSDWRQTEPAVVESTRQRLTDLMRADESEDWLAALLAEKPASRELLRDPDHGFLLLAHTESEGLFRPPHDHGRAWVVYGVHSGALEIRTYGKLEGFDGETRLVLRHTEVLSEGEARAYLPGDVHDTRCIAGPALLFRFTERDLRHEDQVEHRVTRFGGEEGRWTAPRP